MKLEDVRNWLRSRGYAEPELLAIELIAHIARDHVLAKSGESCEAP